MLRSQIKATEFVCFCLQFLFPSSSSSVYVRDETECETRLKVLVVFLD
jgi:hypothetical protein